MRNLRISPKCLQNILAINFSYINCSITDETNSDGLNSFILYCLAIKCYKSVICTVLTFIKILGKYPVSEKVRKVLHFCLSLSYFLTKIWSVFVNNNITCEKKFYFVFCINFNAHFIYNYRSYNLKSMQIFNRRLI